MGFRIWLACVALAFAVPSGAQTSKVDPSLSALATASWPKDNFTTRESRDRLVKAAAQYCSVLDRIMPKNSPAENQWLTSEINGDGDRPERAIRSPEWSRRMGEVFLTDCHNFVSIYWTEGQESKGLVGLGLAFSRFAPEAKGAMRQGKIDPSTYGADVIDFLVYPFLRAALASMD